MASALGPLRRGIKRLRSRAGFVAQTALAAAAAWALADALPGDLPPLFAPIAAVLALSASVGQQTRRALELVLGVTVGLVVADLLILAIGTGTLQIGLVVGLAVGAALLFGGAALLVNQAAVSAIFVATIAPPTDGLAPDRVLHALIGSAIGLLCGQVLFPRDPIASALRAAEPLLGELSRVLRKIADALRSGDPDAARQALDAARELGPEFADFEDAVVAGREVARLSRRRARPQLEVFADAAHQVDLALRNTRVLARAVSNATRQRLWVPRELPDTIDTLAEAVGALAGELAAPVGTESETRRLAREAARRATAALERRQDFGATVIVAQVRATATDLLRGTGVDTEVADDLLGPWPGTEAGARREAD